MHTTRYCSATDTSVWVFMCVMFVGPFVCIRLISAHVLLSKLTVSEKCLSKSCISHQHWFYFSVCSILCNIIIFCFQVCIKNYMFNIIYELKLLLYYVFFCARDCQQLWSIIKWLRSKLYRKELESLSDKF